MARPRYPHTKSHKRIFSDSFRSGQGSLEPEPQLPHQIRSNKSPLVDPIIPRGIIYKGFPIIPILCRINIVPCIDIYIFKILSNNALPSKARPA